MINHHSNSIAVIGMNCRFPDAESIEAFWDLLSKGIAPLNQVRERNDKQKGIIPIHISIQNVDQFDAHFFGYTPREAEVMDPQQRLFLQIAWEVLEIAGYDPSVYKGLIGVFAGASTSTYLIHHLLHHPVLKSIGEFQTLIYNEKDYLTSLLAYHLNLRGPTVTVQSSCSTSLVAIHMACESLLSGQCDMALAGGITLTFPEENYYLYQEGGLVSQDGRIASFDASASGTVYSNGAGIVLLKRLEDAIKDGDNIIALVQGTALNNDGAKRMNFSSPGVEGQSLVISEALALASISADSISYIETHGSGTPLGDSIEFEAMVKAFKGNTNKKQLCALGSVKTNIGHTQVAAGIAGFIKTCLSLYHKKLVPSLNFKTPNPKCDFASSPFYVNTELKEWETYSTPRRACVNSFGLGGSNAHVVLEEYIQNKTEEEQIFPDICLLSAMTDAALRETCRRYKEWIETQEELNLNDLAFTTKVGRKAFSKRLALTFTSKEELIEKLDQQILKSTYPSIQDPNSIFIHLGEPFLFTLSEIKSVIAFFPALSSLTSLLPHSAIFLREVLAQMHIPFLERYLEPRDNKSISPYLLDAYLSPQEKFLNWMGHIWVQGIALDWSITFRKSFHHRVQLPTYPFENKRFFIEKSATLQQSHDASEMLDDIDCIKKTWEEVMGVTIQDLSDNFFENAGHSLLATQLLFALEKKLNKRIALQDFLENPTVEGLIQCVKRCHVSNQHHSPFPEIEPDENHRFDPFPLTDIQQAYWIGRHSELELGNVATHMYFENDLLDLDIEKFEYALNRCIERHDMLRAIILSDGTQKVLKQVEHYTIIYHDLSKASFAEQKEQLSKIREEMSHELIDTQTWPLFKMIACKINERTTRLQISIDLLILDAWSIELWLKELGEIYQNPQKATSSLKLNFRDYVLALKEIEKTPLYEQSKNYWLKRVEEGLSLAPQLPLAKSPSLISFPQFRRFKGNLSLHQWNAIRNIGKKFNLTPPVILMGAFSEVLRLWSSSNNFTLNLTMFNRLPMHPEMNEVLGDFTSLTLLEIKNLQNQSFIDRLKTIQYQVWQDLEHRYFSAPQVVKALMKHTPSIHPTFPIVFTSLLNQSNINSVDSTPFKVNSSNEETYSVSQTPQVWLDHQVMEREDGIHFNWDVLEELFPAEMIETMFQSYTHLLSQLANSPAAWERKDVIRESDTLNALIFPDCNQEKLEQKSELLFTSFLDWAQKEPNRLAIVTPSYSLTYKEVDQFSQQVAFQLLQQGVDPGEMIAIVMNKSWEMLVTILGVLRAGGAYLPIDASYPVNRIQEMLSISQVKMILCNQFSPSFSIQSEQTLLSIDHSQIFSAQDLPQNGSIHQLAYGFFTSGSTGKPKCVEVSHFSALNTIEAINQKYQVDKEDAVLSLSSFSFDLSVYDIFGLLSVGGKIILPELEQAKDPQAWAELIHHNHVTIWNTTPAFMQMFHHYISKTEKEGVLKRLKIVLLSGDTIPVYLPIELKNSYCIPYVVALGGATEASIWSIWYDIQGNESALSSIPYGKAMPNQQFFVLNESLEECPIWVDGDLFIGGVGLATGYRNNLQETQARFIDHPKWGRLYRTGDRGRYKQDGCIEFLGRQDSQVKIRGHRLELGEIEAKLNQHASVKASVVSLDEQKNLIAFVELHSAYTHPSFPEGILTDPMERLQFKISEHGYRKDLANHVIPFSPIIPDEIKETFLRRRSYRQFSQDAITMDQLEKLFSHLRSIDISGLPFGKRLYASGGGLYPIQTYLYIQKEKVANIPGGIYYYHPKFHQLMLVNGQCVISPEIFPPNNRELLKDASFFLFLIANFDAIVPMYGKKESHKLAFLEAGLMTQLLEMFAPDYKIGLCQVSGIDFEQMKTLFSLNQSSELIHCLIGGHVAQEQLSLSGMMKDLETYYANEKKPLEMKNHNPDPATSLREFLTCQLPDYMIPPAIHIVPAIPLTANGKLDRKACFSLKQIETQPDPNPIACSIKAIPLQKEGTALNIELEQMLADIWKEALKGKSFAPTDHFFDIGGNSISLVHVYRAIQTQLNQKISMVDLFKYPTIRSLSNFLNQHTREERSSEEEKARATARREALRKKKENFCTN